jgi:hypothetical protein
MENNIYKKVPILTIDSPTISGKIYSLEIINKIIEQFKSRPYLYGELGSGFASAYFPPNFDYYTINVSRISHQIVDLYIEDNVFYADIKILNTTVYGEIFQNLNKDFLFLGIRATGDFTINKEVIDSDFTFITIDILNAEKPQNVFKK